MFCPECRYEYVRGITTCPDCGVALVDALPPEPAEQPEDFESVILYISLNAALVKSILDDAGISYVMTGDWQSGGYRRIFRVRSEDAEKAKALLAEIDKGETSGWDNTGPAF